MHRWIKLIVLTATCFFFCSSFLHLSKPNQPLRRVEQGSNSVPRLRLLVCISSVHPPGGKSTAHLDLVLAELHKRYAPLYNVSVLVDTNSEALREHLIASTPARAAAVSARVCPGAACEWNMYFPFYHRAFAAELVLRGEIDYLLYTEDDVLVPLEAFQLHISRSPDLWRNGWILGWVRVEQWRGGNLSVLVDAPFPRVNSTVYREPTHGDLYAEPWGAYSACYALDAAQVRAMVKDPSGVYATGFPGLPERERIGVGYSFVFDGSVEQPKQPFHPIFSYWAKGWRARVLVPLTADKQPHPHATVRHLSSRYSDAAPTVHAGVWGSVPLGDMFSWGDSISVEPTTIPQLLVCGVASEYCCVRTATLTWDSRDLPGNCSEYQMR
jgi:hypothetical protein